MSAAQEQRTTNLAREDIVQPFWSLGTEDAFRFLKTSFEGLSEEEAAARLRVFGRNEIPEGRRFAQLALILNQFKSPLIFILIIAALLTAFLGEWIETGVIAAAVAVNTGLGFYQERKAEQVLRLLKSYIRTRTRARRSGREYELDSSALVPGDIIRISQGDRIPADGRIIFTRNFVVNESILTGESLPVRKAVPAVVLATALGDRADMVFSGTMAEEGVAEAVIVTTGARTEFGAIAAFVGGRTQEQTPLQHAISRFAARAGLALGILITGFFFFGLSRGYELFDMFFISVAVAVSAVPEGLPVALTVILAVGVERLGRRKGIVRKLLAAETLGSTDIILTDKTGTLTQAKMALFDILFFDFDQESPDSKNLKTAKQILLSDALMNTDVLIENPSSPVSDWKVSGRSVEIALVRGAARYDVLLPQVQKESQRIDLLPFNSTNKFSVSLFRRGSLSRSVIVGAPEIVLDFADVSLSLRERILQEINARAHAGERVLGVVSKDMRTGDAQNGKHQFRHYQFRGLLTFRDPLRPTVKDAIFRIRQAGVRTVMVTGDHRGTALAVARDLEIVQGEKELLTGEDLMHLNREELKSRLAHINVFARVTPEQKLMLTELFRETGAVVAVTGDGINDAPALAVADIGIAVGSGTDVTKNQADLVILDDNFETIVAAIEEGRTILNNVRKVIVYLLSDSLDEILLIGGALLAGLALPLNALQILFVNFFSDSFPALAFAFERGIDGLGEQPRKLDKNLFDRQMRFLILGIGFLTSAFLFALYFMLLRAGFDGDIVRTFIFASFASYTLFLAFSLRSLKTSIIYYNPFSNHYLTAGAGIGLGLTLAALYVPWLGMILGTTPLPFWWLMGVAGIGALNIVLVELSKWLFRKHLI